MDESFAVRLHGRRRVDLTGKKGRSLILQSGKERRPVDCRPFCCVTILVGITFFCGTITFWMGTEGLARCCTTGLGRCCPPTRCWIPGPWRCCTTGLCRCCTTGLGRCWASGGVGPGRGMWAWLLVALLPAWATTETNSPILCFILKLFKNNQFCLS